MNAKIKKKLRKNSLSKVVTKKIIVFCSRMYMENGKQTGGLYRRSA